MASTAAVGDIFGTGCIVEYVKKTNAAITKGEIIKYSSSGFLKTAASASQLGPFGVCTKDAASTDSVVQAVLNKGAMVYATADGAVPTGAAIIASASTAGQFIVYAARTVSNDTTGIKTAQSECFTVIGRYCRHVDEGNGDSTSPSQATTPTDAADGDVGLIMLGGV